MITETGGLLALSLLALALGAKHGFDADHLATIDGIARYNAAERPWLARATGALFSLGHGVIVTAVACGAKHLHSYIPRWLEASGGAISMTVLLILAFLNFRALRVTPRGHLVRISGLRSRLVGRLFAVSNPLGIALVGMLFGISFDTVSQAALFGLAASQAEMSGQAVLLALSFVCGMIAVDAANSLWMADLVRRADRRAAQATRVMAQTVATLSLFVGLLSALKLLSRTVADWADEQALWLGASVILVGVMGFAIAMIRGTAAEGAS
jgi:high-affinity nickel-transport protein